MATKWTKAKTRSIYFIKHQVNLVAVVLCATMWFVLSTTVYLFESSHGNEGFMNMGDALWWGVVTLLTVGYGDIVPVTVGGKLAASLLMFVGVFTIGIITAKAASVFLADILEEGEKMVKTEKLENHFVICGWKKEMTDFLENVLLFNEGLDTDQIIIIAPIGDAEIRELHEVPKFADVGVIQGFAFQESSLQRAVPNRARRVMIVADQSPNEMGRQTSPEEVDARTIMIANALQRVACGTLVTAEVIDSKFAEPLRHAGVSDIVHSREYMRLLLGNATGGTGITNVLLDLLSPHNGSGIATVPIEKKYIGRSYGDFKAEFEREHAEKQVIGLLANTGNPYMLREQAFRDAQKTNNVRHLVSNLQRVKSMRINDPVFNPAKDSAIGENETAIVIVMDDPDHHAAS